MDNENTQHYTPELQKNSEQELYVHVACIQVCKLHCSQ